MISNDKQMGTPFVDYTDTKANIEALPNMRFGAHAVATDNPTAPFGIYTTSWHWYSTGSVSGASIPIVSSDPPSPTDGELWLLRATSGAIADGLPIGLLLALTYTGATGTTIPLQLSVWDDATSQIIRY